MSLLEFINTFRDFTVFSTYDIKKVFPGFDRKILVAWQKKGYLKKIRNNWYCFADRTFRESDLFLAANKIYSPAYVSMESALSYYHLIPEGVFRITSVSTLKTNHFDTPIGHFDYRHLKPSLFFGYRLVRQRRTEVAGWFKIASVEKTLIDFLYLNPQYNEPADFSGLRFNWREFSAKANFNKIQDFLKHIHSATLSERVQKFLDYYHAQSE